MAKQPAHKLADFWTYVLKTEHCWLWQGLTMPNGYGQFSFRSKKHYSHRFSWALANGPIPDGMSILHRCDVRNCVRPEHLFLGTQSDNIRDMIEKGRRYSGSNDKQRQNIHRGEQCHNARLTVDDVREIRRLRAEGWRLLPLANRYGITYSNVGMICRGDTWRHVD